MYVHSRPPRMLFDIKTTGTRDSTELDYSKKFFADKKPDVKHEIEWCGSEFHMTREADFGDQTVTLPLRWARSFHGVKIVAHEVDIEPGRVVEHNKSDHELTTWANNHLLHDQKELIQGAVAKVDALHADTQALHTVINGESDAHPSLLTKVRHLDHEMAAVRLSVNAVQTQLNVIERKLDQLLQNAR